MDNSGDSIYCNDANWSTIYSIDGVQYQSISNDGVLKHYTNGFEVEPTEYHPQPKETPRCIGGRYHVVLTSNNIEPYQYVKEDKPKYTASGKRKRRSCQ